MKTFTKILFSLSLFSVTTYAAPSGLYVEISGGLGLNDTIETTDTLYLYNQGYIASLTLGYQLDTLRFEIEERFKSDKLHSQSTQSPYYVKADGKLTSNSQMLNFYYSGYNHSNFISSIGLGAGISCVNVENVSDEDTIFSTQALFSIGYKMSNNFISTVKYSYFYRFKSDNFKADGDNTLALSLRYIF